MKDFAAASMVCEAWNQLCKPLWKDVLNFYNPHYRNRIGRLRLHQARNNSDDEDEEMETEEREDVKRILKIQETCVHCGKTFKKLMDEMTATLSDKKKKLMSIETIKHYFYVRSDKSMDKASWLDFPRTAIMCRHCLDNFQETESTIVRTAAKKEYKLTDKDLSVLPFIEKHSFAYNVDMTIYPRSLVTSLAIHKHGSLEELQRKQDRQAQITAKRNATMQRKKEKAERKKEKRKNLLQIALGKRGIALRSDSYLCSTFIETGIGDLPEIVRIMSEMSFLWEKTKYKKVFREARRNYYSDEEQDDEQYVRVQAKNKALFEWCRKNMENCPDKSISGEKHKLHAQAVIKKAPDYMRQLITKILQDPSFYERKKPPKVFHN